jgi:Transcriptional Coactivator p15 (PC4)
MSNNESIVYSFPKNSKEEVKARLSTFQGYRLADIRVWTADANDEEFPTKKGVSVKVEELPKLLEAVQALVAAAEEERAA